MHLGKDKDPLLPLPLQGVTNRMGSPNSSAKASDTKLRLIGPFKGICGRGLESDLCVFSFISREHSDSCSVVIFIPNSGAMTTFDAGRDILGDLRVAFFVLRFVRIGPVKRVRGRLP